MTALFPIGKSTGKALALRAVPHMSRFLTMIVAQHKLKRLLAEAMLDNAGLKDLLSKNW